MNEDASGDVGALQKQIQQLKVWLAACLWLCAIFILEMLWLLELNHFSIFLQDQLSFLMKHHNLSRPLCMPNPEGPKLPGHSSEDRRIIDNQSMLSIENKKVTPSLPQLNAKASVQGLA